MNAAPSRTALFGAADQGRRAAGDRATPNGARVEIDPGNPGADVDSRSALGVGGLHDAFRGPDLGHHHHHSSAWEMITQRPCYAGAAVFGFGAAYLVISVIEKL